MGNKGKMRRRNRKNRMSAKREKIGQTEGGRESYDKEQKENERRDG